MTKQNNGGMVSGMGCTGTKLPSWNEETRKHISAFTTERGLEIAAKAYAFADDLSKKMEVGRVANMIAEVIGLGTELRPGHGIPVDAQVVTIPGRPMKAFYRGKGMVEFVTYNAKGEVIASNMVPVDKAGEDKIIAGYIAINY